MAASENQQAMLAILNAPEGELFRVKGCRTSTFVRPHSGRSPRCPACGSIRDSDRDDWTGGTRPCLRSSSLRSLAVSSTGQDTWSRKRLLHDDQGDVRISRQCPVNDSSLSGGLLRNHLG